MQNLKQKLADQGLSGSLLLRENGVQIPLRFEKGQTRKWGKLTLGAVSMDVEFVLEEIPGAPAEHPNLRLVIQTGPAPKVDLVDTLKVQTAAVDVAAKTEANAAAEAKVKAEAAVKAKLAEDQAAANTTGGADTSSAATTPTTTTSNNATANKTQNNGGFKKGN